jgi:hypothetical protein
MKEMIAMGMAGNFDSDGGTPVSDPARFSAIFAASQAGGRCSDQRNRTQFG